jgi:hypothetical protein
MDTADKIHWRCILSYWNGGHCGTSIADAYFTAHTRPCQAVIRGLTARFTYGLCFDKGVDVGARLRSQIRVAALHPTNVTFDLLF